MSNPGDNLPRANLGDIARVLAQAMEWGEIPRREFRVPDLPPGVVPQGAAMAIACDNAIAGNGWLNGGAGQGFCGLGFPGYTYLAELAQKSEYRAPSEVTAEEMTRAWIEITGATESELEELQDGIIEFQLEAHINSLILIDGLFGRSQLSINIKGQDTDKRRQLPLIVDDTNKASTIPKGSLDSFKPIEPIWTTPWAYNSLYPERPDFYRPDWWYVLGRKTHASRLLTYISHPLPDILKPSYNFSGLSLSQLIEPYVIRWLKTVDSVNRMISNYSTSGIATDLQATLEDKGVEAGGMDLFKRASMFTQMRDNRGIMLLDKSSEEFFQYNTPLSGLSELQAQAQEHMAAPTHLPLVKLTGITPSGLNASSEGELKVMYDHMGAKQKGVTPILTTALKVLQCHLWGKVNPKIKAKWVPLDSPSDKELSEMRKADSDAGVGYVTAGVIDADEERERLRTDPRSAYRFIKGPAPTPPDLEEQNNAAQLGEEGKDADAERGEESADNAHARAKDMEAHKAKLAPKA